MYEIEALSRAESARNLPANIISAFSELSGKVLARTLLPWGEHCTECVWPTCYATCDLYEPREDLKCRRFVDGMVRVKSPASATPYLLKIRFKKWGKLWTLGSLRLYPIEAARKSEKRHQLIGGLYHARVPAWLKRHLVRKSDNLEESSGQRSAYADELPESFLLECYNPQDQMIPLNLIIRSRDPDSKIPFQKRIDLEPGFRRLRIPLPEISAVVDLGAPFSLEIIPNVLECTTLYFGTMDFVREARAAETEDSRKIKCLVWDLDKTLWDGILIEDGPEKLRLKPAIIDVIQELDRRGILHSIASKNNREQAWQVLKDFHVDEYFLCPQISWQPKAEAVKAIARELNIATNTLLLVDDSDFELQQIKLMCPEVRVLRAERFRDLLEMKECQVPVTAESATRRKMYQIEGRRQAVASGFGQDYMAFLRQCNIKLNLWPLTSENLERVHELTQRTNQMNFSGNRYSRELLREILSSLDLETYVLECEDSFGSYGVIGFSVVDRREVCMTDLMFSCRVQSKRLEHAFLGFLIRKYVAESGKDFYANYRRTEHNAASGTVFADFGMQETCVSDGVSRLVFPKDHKPLDDGIIKITMHRDVAAASRS